jgi:hypothetical protein
MARQMIATKEKKDTNVITGKMPKRGTGHKAHRGGCGQHKHKCDRRTGNRSQQTSRCIGEW